MAQLLAWYQISIHAPRMGSDMKVTSPSDLMQIFQSTLPGWGATRPSSSSCQSSKYFNPRSPDGERPTWCARAPTARTNFNPRSPDGERRGVRHAPGVVANFNPRSPDGERPSRLGEHHRHAFISIHAPRMGSDRKGNRLRSRHSKFQSTLPGWGATGVLFEHIQAHNHFNPRSPDGERP